ncbi:MAG: DNA primase [Candidatus Buchananbacteria bacterium]
MSNQVEEIKARVDIVDLISEYIHVKPAGTNNWRALCPFHNEKSPSFMISKDKQIWHCFGCSEGGDIFSFVQKMEGIDFPEALRLLAEKAGVKLEHHDPKLASQKNKLMDITKLTAAYWHKILTDSPAGQKARDYLKNRGVTDQTITDFKIGYAPDTWDNLIKFLKSRGFNDQEIFSAGLSVKKERGNDFYDRFRDRVMFPINDLHGSPIGFSGRTLKVDEKMGKYINTPQTMIYNKSLVLFNLDKAKQEIKKQDLAIIVEGQMDCISAYAAGTANVIASSGTAFTEDQISILKRYTNNLAISFDMDQAGESAAKRGIDLALAQEMNVKVIVLPSGKDPDECIKTNPQLWFGAVANAKTIMEFYFEKTFSKFDISQAEGKKAAAKILLPMITKMNNKIEQTHWLQKLGEALSVSEQILREALPGGKIKKPSLPAAAVIAGKDRKQMLDQQLLAIVLKYPHHLSFLIDNLPNQIITDQAVQELYKKLIIYYTESINGESQKFNYQEFHQIVKNEGLDQIADKLVLLAEKDFFDFDSDAIREELVQAINQCKRYYYRLRFKEIEDKLRLCTQIGRKDQEAILMQEFNEVTSALNLLE